MISSKYVNQYVKNMGRRFATENFIMRREAYKKVDNLSEHVLDSLSHCNKEVIKHIADEIFSKVIAKGFVEIPRKECGNQVISASLVRRYLKEKKFDEIVKLVPTTTLEYLKKNYK